MTAAALLALLNAAPTSVTKPPAPNKAALATQAIAWRSTLATRTEPQAHRAIATQSDPLVESVTSALTKAPFETVVATAAKALGTAVASIDAKENDPAAFVTACATALAPDPGAPPVPIPERVRTLVARLRTIAEAAARVSATTTGQKNRFPGNDLDAATAAKANPAPSATGTHDAATSLPLVDRLLAIVRSALASPQLAPPFGAPQVIAPPVSAHVAVVPIVTGPAAPSSSSATTLAAFVGAIAHRQTPADRRDDATTTSALAATIALPFTVTPIPVTVWVRGAAADRTATIVVPDDATRVAVESRREAIVAELVRGGNAVATVEVVVEPTKVEPTKAEPTKAEPPKAEPPKAEPPKAEAAPRAAGQVLTAAAFRTQATGDTQPSVPGAAIDFGRALPIIESIVQVPADAPETERATAPTPLAVLPEDALVVTSGENLAVDDARAAAPQSSVAKPLLLDVPTLAALSAPPVPVQRDAATTVLVQAIAQVVAQIGGAQAQAGPQPHGEDPPQQRPSTRDDAPSAVGMLSAPMPVVASAPIDAPAPLAPSDPFGLVEQLANAVIRSASGHAQAVSELHVRLTPENLGELTVAIRVDGVSVSAQVTTHDAATQAVLSASGDGLAKTLAAAGLRLDGYAVALAGGTSDFGRGSAQAQQERARGRKASMAPVADDVDPTTPVATSVAAVQRPGALDERV